MLRNILTAIFVVSFSAAAVFATTVAKGGNSADYRLKAFAPTRLIGGEEGAAAQEEELPAPPRDEYIGDPRGLVAIGDDYLIGYTWYEYQANGSMGKMIAKDSQGNLHFTYMCGYQSTMAPRHMLYNLLSNDALYFRPTSHDGKVDAGDKSGYGHLALMPLDERAAIFFHVVDYPGAPDETYLSSAMGLDYLYGYAAFESSYVPAWANVQMAWPMGTIDRQNFAHVFDHEYTGVGGSLWARIGYSRGVPEQDYLVWTWFDNPVNVDTTAVISQVVASSPTSNKVVLAWHHNRVTKDDPAWDGARGAVQKNNDLRYIVSEDGENWDWDNDVKSITKIIPPNVDLIDDVEKAWGDTFRPYCDVDIEFDPWGDDNLYATFETSGFWEKPIADPDPVNGVTGEMGHLWFWNSELDTITLIYDGWYWNRRYNGASYNSSRCGGWRMNSDRGSIAFNPEDPGTIYVVWVNFPHIQNPIIEGDYIVDWEWLEGAQDTSEQGYSNAEIMVSVSDDYGISWHQPVNITNTRWEGDHAPAPGECMSENWVSAAYLADDSLHIFYIFDTDAGGYIQTENDKNEGTATNCPVIYHRVAISDLPETDLVEMPRDGFMFHNYPVVRLTVPDVVRTPGVPLINEAVVVNAEVAAGEGDPIASVEILYRVNKGDTLTVSMDAIDATHYSGSIPSQQDGSMVWYKVRGTAQSNFKALNPREDLWYSYTVRDGGPAIYDIQYRPNEWKSLTDASPYRGYEVTVAGVVTTPASFNDAYGAYAIQDSSKPWNGVMVRGIQEALQEGQKLSVTGTVMEQDPLDSVKWEFATYIDVSSYEVLGNGEVPLSVQVSYSDLTFASGCEALEAVLVTVYFVTVDTGAVEVVPGGKYWPLKDDLDNGAWFASIGMPQADRDSLASVGAGVEFDEISGVFAENFGHYAILPRTMADIIGLAVNEKNAGSPLTFKLYEAYPNPFNSVTKISFDLPQSGWAHLAVYDLTGRAVAEILDGEVQAGGYNLAIDASSLATGVYILRLETERSSAAQKLVLVK